MPGEGQLLTRRKNSQPVIRLIRPEQERRFGKIGPAGDALHGRRIEIVSANYDRDGVAEERPVGEDVDLLECKRRHGQF
jgi:hypothetical protein